MSEKKRRTHLVDDMFITFMATFALAAFSYEKYMPESFMKIFNVIVFIAFAYVWLGFSFKSGCRKGYGFPIFAVLFWVVPQLLIYLANSGPKALRLSVTMYIISEFSMLFTTVPAQTAGSFAGISTAASIIVILLLCAAAYMTGLLFRVRRDG